MTFRIDVHHHIHLPMQPAAVMAALEKIMNDQAQTKAILEEINTNLTEASAELTSKLEELTAALAAAGQNTPEVDALLDAIRTKAKALADVVPNEQPAPPAPPEEPGA